jgi:hypothetical protein
MGNDMNKSLGNEVLLTMQDIRQWQEELVQAERRAAELRKKLEGAALIFGSKFSLSDLPKSKEGTDDQESMGDATMRLLQGFHRAVFHYELIGALRNIPKFREMLDKNKGAYYYTMIRRLVKDGKVKKAGKKVRLPIPHNETPSEGNPEGAPKSTVEG